MKSFAPFLMKPGQLEIIYTSFLFPSKVVTRCLIGLFSSRSAALLLIPHSLPTAGRRNLHSLPTGPGPDRGRGRQAHLNMPTFLWMIQNLHFEVQTLSFLIEISP